jgi:hypothetical protein
MLQGKFCGMFANRRCIGTSRKFDIHARFCAVLRAFLEGEFIELVERNTVNNLRLRIREHSL